MKKKGTVALRKVDIVNWQSDVARQHRIRQIPTLWLYEGQKRVETDSRKVLDRIQNM